MANEEQYEEQRYVIYEKNKSEPFGTLRESTLGAFEEIAKMIGRQYIIEPITPQQAEEITNSILRKISCSLDDKI